MQIWSQWKATQSVPPQFYHINRRSQMAASRQWLQMEIYTWEFVFFCDPFIRSDTNKTQMLIKVPL